MIIKLAFANHDATSRYKVVMTSKEVKRKFFVPEGMAMPIVHGGGENVDVIDFRSGPINIVVFKGGEQVHTCTVNARTDGTFHHKDAFLTISQE